ncbi:MAG: RDD family protein [Pirellulales bacterium]|nr:RDD family protein [Pirellulales bacterium]
MAFTIDMVLLLIIVIPLLFAVFWEDLSRLDPANPPLKLPIGGPMYYLIVYVLPTVAVLIFWKFKSATPGKMIFSARIVDARSNGRPSLSQFVVRCFAYVVSTIPLCLGFLWIAFDRRKQGWHDKLAGTVVVRMNAGRVFHPALR